MVRRIVDGLVDDTAAAPEQSSENAETSSSGDVQRIAIGSDHGGFAMKERLAFRLREKGHDIVDCGTNSTESVDYPDIAADVARRVAEGTSDIGIVIDGAGIGSAMAANKISGVRAALCYDISTAHNAREHNHANLLTLGAGLVGDTLAWQIVEEFLTTPYGEGRHARRVDKITQLERTDR